MDALDPWAILNTQAIWAQAHSQPISTTVSYPVTSMMNVVEVATTLQPPHWSACCVSDCETNKANPKANFK